MVRFLWLVFLVAAGVTAGFLLFGSHSEAFVQELLDGPVSALLALAIFGLLAGDVVLPVPSSLLAAGAGVAFGPFLGGIVAACGLSFGACGGFLLARKWGTAFWRRVAGEEDFARIENLLDRHGTALLIVLRAVPVLAETSVLAAGAGGAPPGRSLAVLLLGSSATGFGYAYLGAMALEEQAFLIAAGISIILPAAALLGWRNARVAGSQMKRLLVRHRR